jgi:hypothetical protein
MITIPDADYSFVAAVIRQLHPVHRPVIAQRVYEALADICEPGPGDVDRAVRVALKGIWEPAPDRQPSRWSRVR